MRDEEERADGRDDQADQPDNPRESEADDAQRRDAAASGLGPADHLIESPRRTRDRDVWDTFQRWRSERRRFVLATVTESRGFTPRKPGARMLIAAGGETCGTIGGGAIESAVLEEARALLERGGTTVLRRHLTQELGMCCGGEMSVFLEVVEVAVPLYVFGAGYISKPLAAIASGCGFDVTVVDARPEWATGERFPTARVVTESPEDFARTLDTRGDEFVVVVTHDHALDQRLVQLLLVRPVRFIGMIGSIPKQRKFALRLRARGFSDADIARLRTPLGLDIGADGPEEIAVSVMAELIAVRRGHAPSSAWTPRPDRAQNATPEAHAGRSADAGDERDA